MKTTDEMAKNLAANRLKKNTVTISLSSDDPLPMGELIKALTSLLPKKGIKDKEEEEEEEEGEEGEEDKDCE